MMKRMLSLLLVLIMVLGMVPFQVNAQQQSSDVVYVDENTSLEDLEAMGLVQTTQPTTQPVTLPETPTTVKPEAETDTDKSPVRVPDNSQAETALPETICSCGKADADIYHHSDNCALRAYYLQICAGSAQRIFSLWRSVGVVTQGFLEDYLSAKYPEKLVEMMHLRDSEAIVDDSQQADEAAKERLPGEASTTVDGITVDALGVPEGSSLKVQEPSADVVDKVEQIVAEGDELKPEQVFFYDISVQSGKDKDWQPDGTSVKMTLTIPGLDLPQYSEVRIIHVDDEGNDSLIKGEVDADGNIVFETGGFSTFAGFTVEFTFGGAMVSIPGKTSTTLGTLFQEMKMPLKASDVVDVQFTDYSLLTVTKEENDWRLTSLVAFSTHETLTFTMADGATYEFMVTDAQHPQVSVGGGGEGPWETDDNDYTRWFSDGDGKLNTTGTITGNYRSYYWSETGIVYIKGAGKFTIAIQPNGSRDKGDQKQYVNMKQVRVMGGAHVEFYVGTHYVTPDSGTYSNTSPWSSMQEVVVRASDTSCGLFYVEDGSLNLEGQYMYNSSTKKYQTILLTLEGNVTSNTTSLTAEPLVNLREGCTKFTAKYVKFTNCASGGIFSKAKRMTLFDIQNCTFDSTVHRVKSYSNSKWVYMNGGAIYFNEGDDGQEKIIDYVYMANCTFNGNEAGSYGGAVFFGDRIRMVLVKNCQFTGCKSGASGGAIAVRATIGQFHVAGSTFTNCTAKKDGGGIHAETLAINSSTNYNRLYEFRVADTDFVNCIATAEHEEENDGIGGGINLAIQTNLVNISTCTFDGCQARGGSTNLAGGGIAFGYANLGDTGNNPDGDMKYPWTEDLQYHKRDGEGYLLDADGNRITGDHDDDSSTAAKPIKEARHDTGNKRVLYGGEGTYRDTHEGWWMDSESEQFYRQRITFGTVNIMNNTTVKNTTNTYQGGGFIVRTGCSIEDLNVTDMIIDNCDVTDKGSAVFFNNCNIGYCDFVNCTFKNCDVVETISEGGGTIRTVGKTACAMTFDRCKFLDNNGNIAGGGIYWNAGNSRKTPGGIERETKAIIKDCEFRRNKATGTVARPVGQYRYGGGIFCETIMSVERCIFDGNESEIGGGLSMGVYNSDYRMFSDNETTKLVLDSQTEFYHNMAKRGGGLAIRANSTQAIANDNILTHTVEFVLNGAKVYSNAASEVGGGIYYVAETYTADPDKPDYDPELDNAEVRRYIKKITLDEGLVYSNCASKDGGGIYVDSSYNTTVNVSDASVYSNVAGINSKYTPASTNGDTSCTCEQTKYALSDPGGNGGGIYLAGVDATVNITGGYIGAYVNSSGNITDKGNIAYGRTANTNSGFGGGLALFGGASLTITGGYIADNEAQRDGGGFSINDNADVIMTGGYIQHNKADTKNNSNGSDGEGSYQGIGGGIALSGGSMTCYGGTFQDNHAYNGGAIGLKNGATLTMVPSETTVDGETVITYALITENGAYHWGGGIYLAGTTDAALANSLLINEGIISNNHAKNQNGGGIYVGQRGTLEMTGGEVFGNKTATWGGGVYVGGNTWGFEETKAGFAVLNGGKIYNNEAGTGGGICAQDGARVTVDGCVIHNNRSNNHGGGIYSTYSWIYLSAGSIYSNHSDQYGGAISATASQITLVGGEIYQNTAQYGGGLYLTCNQNDPTVLSITNGKLYGNTATEYAGGIYMIGSNATISGGEIYQNTSICGGGIFLMNETGGAGSELEITNGKIYGNTAIYNSKNEYGNGGAIYAWGSKVTLNGGEIYNNLAMERGGAIYSNVSEFVLHEGLLYGNVSDNTSDDDEAEAAGSGGALHLVDGTALIDGGQIGKLQSDDTYIGNRANRNGGAGYFSGVTLTINDGTFLGNNAGNDAGGMYVTGGTITIGGGSFTSNYSTRYGGGAYFQNATVDFTNGTFVDNASKNGGGLCIIDCSAARDDNKDTIEFTGGSFQYNVADRGGAMFIRSSSVTIKDIVVDTNYAKEDSRFGDTEYRRGGGICIDTYGNGPAVIDINGGTFSGNHAYNGGALWMRNNSESKENEAILNITGGEFAGNRADNDGGGIWIGGGDIATTGNVTKLTMNGGKIGGQLKDRASGGNYAKGNGGGIWAGEQAQVNILATETTHGEIDNNSATNGGGIFVSTGADLVVNNGYITNNTAVSPSNAEELSSGYWDTTTWSSSSYKTSLHGSGGGVCVVYGASAAKSTFTLSGDQMAIYGNTATFAGDDVFSNGRMTKLNVPTVVNMDLAGYEFNPEGWFEDYNEGDARYANGLEMIPYNGGHVNYVGDYTEGVQRYRNTDGITRRYMHIHPEYVLGTGLSTTDTYVNKENAYVAMTLGIPAAVEDVIVLDYGNKLTLNVWQNDLFMDQVDFAETPGVTGGDQHNSLIGYTMPDNVEYKDGVYYSKTRSKYGTDYGIFESYFQSGMHGKISNLKNGLLTYEPNTLSMEKEDAFFYMVRHRNIWYYAHVTVVPATSIYFEDNFKKDSTLQIEYHEESEYEELASWETVGTDEGLNQSQDRPGSLPIGGLDADNIYGYDPNYGMSSHSGSNPGHQYANGRCTVCGIEDLDPNTTSTYYSGGTAHKVTVSRHYGVDANGDNQCDVCGVAVQMTHDYVSKNSKGQCKTCLNTQENHGSDVPAHECREYKTYNEYCDFCGKWIGTHTTNARATFTFTGTGFDVVGLSSAATGIVMVTVYRGTVTDFDNPPWDDYVASFMVDTFYGYAYDEDLGKWVPTEDSDEIFYQVPVIKADMDKILIGYDSNDNPIYDSWGYGTYSVEIYIAPSYLEREHGYWNADFYLDGIRVYNPAGDGVRVETDAEGKETTNSTIQDAYIADGEGWPVYAELRNMFITQNELGVNTTNGIIFIDGRTEATLAEYKSWGPNNEVYLNPGESVAFTLNASNYALSAGGDLNSNIVAGVHLGMRGLTGLGKVTIYQNQSKFKTIDMGTTDMYYDITDLMNKVVTITNEGTTPISLSNVKITHKYAPVVTSEMGTMFTMNEMDANLALNVFTPEMLADPVLKPKYPALSFEGMVSYNVFFTAEDLGDLNGADLGLAVFGSYEPEGTVETAKDVIMGATMIDGLYMVATNGVHAKYLGDTQYFRAFAKQEDGTYIYSKMVSYSALDYAKNTLAKSNDVKLKQLVVAMLNYGAEAQKFFGYDTENLMNKDLTADQLALVDGIDASALNAVGKVDASKVGEFVSTGGFAKKYPAISFKGAFEINYFMAPSNTVNNGVRLYIWNEDTYNSVDELTFTNADKKVDMVYENGMYTASSDQIAAKDLDQTVYVAAIYESNGQFYCSGVLPYSIAAYCQKPAADVAALANAAAIYGAAAKEFFGV